MGSLTRFERERRNNLAKAFSKYCAELGVDQMETSLRDLLGLHSDRQCVRMLSALHKGTDALLADD